MLRLDSLEALLGAVRDWQGRLSRIAPPERISPPVRREKVRDALRNVERRLVEGARAPLRFAIFGPTGAGKSKLFNSLVGESLSAVSYRRPSTRRPLFYLHRRFEALAGGLAGDVRLHDRAGDEDLILIDAPDFDSVEIGNRDAAERIYLEADAFIFVADVHKYADASVWNYLERIRSEGKRAIFVLNKVSRDGATPSGGPLEDFQDRIARMFGRSAGPVIGVADIAQADEDVLPAGEPGVRSLRDTLREMRATVAGGGPALLGESLRIDLNRVLGAWDAFAGPLAEYRDELERLRAELESRLAREVGLFSADLEADLDPALKNEVYREVLRRIERMDILRYPRRLLALPVTGLQRVLGHFWPRLRGDSGEPVSRESSLDAANLALLERRVQDLSGETLESIRSRPAAAGILDDAAESALALDHDAIREQYLSAAARFKAWADAQARSTAATLTAEHKVEFLLSQVLYNTVVIGIQIKTAGTLTLGEMLTDGILSPLVAKVVGMAVSSSKVQEFEAEARRKHAAELSGVLQASAGRFEKFLAAALEGVAPLGPLAAEIEELRSSRDCLVDLFLRSAR